MVAIFFGLEQVCKRLRYVLDFINQKTFPTGLQTHQYKNYLKSMSYNGVQS
jgi:hypothetical protein